MLRSTDAGVLGKEGTDSLWLGDVEEAARESAIRARMMLRFLSPTTVRVPSRAGADAERVGGRRRTRAALAIGVGAERSILVGLLYTR